MPYTVQVSNFTNGPIITSLSGNVGSLGGGLPLTVNIGGAGLPTGPNTSVVVSVGGLPCPVLGSVTATQLTCRAPAATPGTALAEYWNIGDPGYIPASGVPMEAAYGPPGM